MLSPQFLIVSLIAGLELLSLADGDPMIEVFRWKQMDFYNRGDVHPMLGGRRDRPSHSGEFKLSHKSKLLIAYNYCGNLNI